MGVRCRNWRAQKTGKWFQVVSQEKQFASGMFQPSRAEQHPTPCAGIQYSSFIQCHRGGQTWAQHKLNPINSYAEESVNKASPTKKEPNCLRIATISGTWGQSFYSEIQVFAKGWHVVWEQNPGLTFWDHSAAAAINCGPGSQARDRTRWGQHAKTPGGMS